MKKVACLILITLIITGVAIVRVTPATAMSGCEDTCDHNTNDRRSFSKCMSSCKKEAAAKADRQRNMKNERGEIITDVKYKECLATCNGPLSTQSRASCIQGCKNAAAGK